ncbi:MAG TPA: DUF4864 domain-containing protein [Methylomirabilota bacterium]|nr:DUF4864 domain-containing protein [Methylomirabilota bacterium]
MQVRRVVLGLTGVLTLALCASAGAQAEKESAKAAAEPVVKQLEAFRRDDYDTAYTFASEEIRQRFDRRGFEDMVRDGYPEIARSASASVVGTELRPDGLAYVTIKIRGANGQSVEALYEMIWQGAWRINAVVTRPDRDTI